MSYKHIPFGSSEKFNVVVEIQKGGKVKYEYDEDWDEIKVKEVRIYDWKYKFVWNCSYLGWA